MPKKNKVEEECKQKLVRIRDRVRVRVRVRANPNPNPNHLGREVFDRAYDGVGAVLQLLRIPKVDELDVTVGAHHDVLRLEVAVHHII